MAEAYNLTTKTKVKAMLDITGSTEDSLLDSICDQVTAYIEGLAGGQRFKMTTHDDEIHDGDNGQWIILRHRFIYDDATIKVEYNNGTNVTPSWVELTADEYQVYLENGTVYLDSKIAGKRNIRVSYTAGFNTIPYDLELAATTIACRIYNRRKSQGAASESFEGVAINWNDVLNEADRAIITKYTRFSFI